MVEEGRPWSCCRRRHPGHHSLSAKVTKCAAADQMASDVEVIVDGGMIEAPSEPILWSYPFTVLSRKNEVVLVGYGVMLCVMADHIQGISTKIDKAASGRGLRDGYFPKTLQRPVHVHALVGQVRL